MSNNSNDSFLLKLHDFHSENWLRSVDSKKVFEWFDGLFDILFPEKISSIPTMERLWNENKRTFSQLLEESLELNKSDCVELFYTEIAKVYESLQKDALALLQTDPAATSISEVINSYPGFFAIASYRISNALDKLDVPIIPRIISEYAHSKTGIDIHPRAKIGIPFIIDHGTGIVIGETCEIGDHVSIYQGVTLGALQVDKSMEEKKRHPTIENNVVIYANATILGGSTIIGNNSIVGGNAFITKSIDPYSVIMQSSKNNVQNLNTTNNFFSI